MSSFAMTSPPPLVSTPPALNPARFSEKSGVLKLVEKPNENILAVSWLLAITVAFFVTGVVGFLQPDFPAIQITLSGMAGAGQDDAPAQETTMAELEAQLEQSSETVVEEVPVEIPEPIEMVPEVTEDIPEIAEALVTEDVFTVPVAPQIEQALTPVDPAKPKPQVKPQPRRPTARVASSRSTGTSTGTAAVSGGGSGTGTSGTGGAGRMPKPPYPSWARSAGIQGTVRVSISVTPSGDVASASVIGTCGSSRLDEHAASCVRRMWKFPPGASRRYNFPISFRLR